MRLATLTLVLSFIVSFSLIAGCGGAKKPSGFPDLVPHSIVVKNGGVAEAGVSVSLLPENLSGSWAVGGTTDAEGKTKLATFQGDYTKFGAPAGKFKVVLSKTVRPASEVSEEEYIRMSQGERDVYGQKMAEEMKKLPIIVPESLTTSKTPLTIDISKETPETVVELNDFKN
jgi:hypothetical protein